MMMRRRNGGMVCALVVGLAAWAVWAPVLAGEVVINTSPRVAGYFAKAKKNQAELLAFLHKMPKGADLHNHPSGAAATETLVAIAMAQNLYFDRELKAFVKEKPVGPYFAPEDLKAAFWNMSEVLESLSLRNNEKSRESGHEKFFRSFFRFGAALPDDLPILKEVMARAASQNIGYLELMTVVSGPEWLEKAEAFRREVERESAEKGKYRPLEVRYIQSLVRTVPPEQFAPQVEEAMRVARENPELVVGITILAPEDEYHSQKYFKDQMRMIDEAYRRAEEAHLLDPAANPPPPKFNLHAGELTPEYATYESMLDRISETIRLGHASRIGHGTSVMWEDDVYGLLKFMRDCGVAVEICLSSSEGILKVAGGDTHPFALYWRAGVPVVLATDDEGVSRGNLTIEYAKAAKWFGLSYGELKWLAFSALEYAFLPGESYFVGGDFNRVRPDAYALVGQSRKAYLQCGLMNDFAEFERKMENVIQEFGW